MFIDYHFLKRKKPWSEWSSYFHTESINRDLFTYFSIVNGLDWEIDAWNRCYLFQIVQISYTSMLVFVRIVSSEPNLTVGWRFLDVSFIHDLWWCVELVVADSFFISRIGVHSGCSRRVSLMIPTTWITDDGISFWRKAHLWKYEISYVKGRVAWKMTIKTFTSFDSAWENEITAKKARVKISS